MCPLKGYKHGPRGGFYFMNQTGEQVWCTRPGPKKKIIIMEIAQNEQPIIIKTGGNQIQTASVPTNVVIVPPGKEVQVSKAKENLISSQWIELDKYSDQFVSAVNNIYNSGNVVLSNWAGKWIDLFNKSKFDASWQPADSKPPCFYGIEMTIPFLNSSFKERALKKSIDWNQTYFLAISNTVVYRQELEGKTDNDIIKFCQADPGCARILIGEYNSRNYLIDYLVERFFVSKLVF